MPRKRGAYRHKAVQTTGDQRKDMLREQTGLSKQEWRQMEKALNTFLGEDGVKGRLPTASVKAKPSRRHGPKWIKWRVSYCGPSLALAMLAAAASRAVERGITQGKITRPEAQAWVDPWQDFQ